MAEPGAHSERVSRKRRMRKREIVRSALAIAAAEGPDAVTVQRLAAHLDYTPGALYRYFPSKDALVAELQRAVIAYLGEATEGVAGRADAWARGRVGSEGADTRALAAPAAIGLAFARFSTSHPAAFRLLSMHLGDPEYKLAEADARYVHEATTQTLSSFAGPLRRAAAAGAIADGDATERAMITWAALQGVLQARKLARHEPGGLDIDRLVRSALRALLIGWGARAEAVDLALDGVDKNGIAVFDGSPEEFLLGCRQESKAGG